VKTHNFLLAETQDQIDYKARVEALEKEVAAYKAALDKAAKWYADRTWILEERNHALEHKLSQLKMTEMKKN